MGVFSTDLDRVGLLSNEALRAARLVVDAGMHTLGWTRQQAIDYLLEHTAESEASATAEIDRYIAVPGQATAYMLGNLEIRRLRDEASERLGEGFDIKAFHDRLLEDGTVTLAMMREKAGGRGDSCSKTVTANRSAPATCTSTSSAPSSGAWGTGESNLPRATSRACHSAASARSSRTTVPST
jgi:hypothetical protein